MSKTLNVPEEDKQYLELLTDEERAGLEEGADFDEDQEEGTEGATAGTEGEGEGEGEGGDAANGNDATAQGEGEGEGEGEGDGDDADPAAAAAAADHGTAAAADDVTGAEGEGEGEGDYDLSFAAVPPVPVSRLPDDYEDKVKELATKKEEVLKQFEEGDIGVSEYHKELDALNRTERELERTKDRHDDNERRRYEVWSGTHVVGFMKKHTEYGSNEMLTGLLDQEVRKLQASGKYDSDTDPKILIDAHKKISASLPGAFKSAAAPAPKQGNKAPAKPAAKKPAVPTLARVPAADIDNPGEGEFDMLDRMLETDPLRYQRECEKLARTNPEKYEQYLASQ